MSPIKNENEKNTRIGQDKNHQEPSNWTFYMSRRPRLVRECKLENNQDQGVSKAQKSLQQTQERWKNAQTLRQRAEQQLEQAKKREDRALRACQKARKRAEEEDKKNEYLHLVTKAEADFDTFYESYKENVFKSRMKSYDEDRFKERYGFTEEEIQDMIVYWDTLTKDELKRLIEFAVKHHPWTWLKFRDGGLIFKLVNLDQDKGDWATYSSIHRALERLPIVFPELISCQHDAALYAERKNPMHNDLKRWRCVVRAIVKAVKEGALSPIKTIGDVYNDCRWTWE